MLHFGKKVKLGLKLLLSFGILYLLFRQLDWEQASEIIGRANPALLLLPFLVMVLDRIWMAWKWRMLVEIMGPAPSMYEAVRVYYISSFQGLALPLGGLGPDLVRYAHMRSSHVSSHAVAVSIVMERIIGLLATLIVATMAAGLLIHQVEYGEQVRVIIRWVLTAAGVGVVFLMSLLFSKSLQQTIYHYIGRVGFVSRHPSFQRLTTALKQNSDAPGVLFGNLILSVIEQCFPVAAYALGALAFQIPLSLLDCLAVVPISTLFQRLPISYAGLGVREGVLVYLLGLLGISFSNALILSTSMFVILVCSMLVGAVWSFVKVGFEPESKAGRCQSM
jgi:uncharacterized protein (TIRG00374 family)